MNRIAMLGASVALGAMASMGQMAGVEPVPLVRAIAPVVTNRKKTSGGKRRIGSSKYMPHIGAKEQERAKRLYESRFVNERFVSVAQFMHPNLPSEMCHERSTPTLCQMSKRQYELSRATLRAGVLAQII